jgi:uncharacterized protein
MKGNPMVTANLSPRDLNSPRFLFYVDGPNIDRTLANVLRRRPQSKDRPRWNIVLQNLTAFFGRIAAHFVLNGDRSSDAAMGFFRALDGMGYRIPTPSRHDYPTAADPVDAYIIVRISHCGFGSTIILASHDEDFAPALSDALNRGARVIIVGFREWLSPELASLLRRGAQFLDLELDLNGFDFALVRPF